MAFFLTHFPELNVIPFICSFPYLMGGKYLLLPFPDYEKVDNFSKVYWLFACSLLWIFCSGYLFIFFKLDFLKINL